MFRFIKRLAKQLGHANESLSEEGHRNLIRRLVRERVQRDPLASAAAEAEGLDLYDLPEHVALTLPDASIVAIVGEYLNGKRMGMDDEQVIGWIHSRRITAPTPFAFPPLPIPLTLRTYIRYFLDSQHGHGVPVSVADMDTEIDQAKKFYEQ